MSVLALEQEAQLAEEVIATVLQGALHRHGSQKAFAACAGVSPVHVNYIIHKIRMPTCEMAERLAQHLPLSRAECQTWVGYVNAFWRAKHALARALPAVIQDDFPSLAQVVQQLRVSAVTTNNPDAARLSYRIAMTLSSRMLRTAVLALHPLLYLQTIEVFQEVTSFLGQRVDALWAARRLQWVAEDVVLDVRREERAKVHLYRLNGLRLETAVLNDLHLHARAYQLTRQLQADPLFKTHFQPWTPPVIWDRMNAMSHMPRACRHEARDLWQMGMKFCDYYAKDWAEPCSVLVTRSYAEVLISHGRFAEAHHLLDGHYVRMDSIPYFGAFYQVLLGQTYARLLWEEPQRDQAQWEAVMTRTHGTALRAGFTQQLREMQEAYGEARLKAIVAPA